MPPQATLDLEPADLTPEDLSTLFGIGSTFEVVRLVRTGRLPPPDLHFGRRRRWRRSTVVAWIESQRSQNGGAA